jgi:V/A-type H+/Na+-transporting ATPase subunit E
MKKLENGHEVIKRICDDLKNEALVPAKLEAKEIIAKATQSAEQILGEAKDQAKKIVEEARKSMELERNIFQTTLEQAAKKCLEALRQNIEHHFFNEELQQLIIQQSSGEEILTKLINAIVAGIEKEGISKDFTVFIPACCSAEELVKNLLPTIVEKLDGRSLVNGTFGGGVQVKLHDKKLTLVLTDKEIGEYLRPYVRKDFHKYVYSR